MRSVPLALTLVLVVALPLMALLIALPAHAQSPEKDQQAAQTFTEATSVIAVEVPVTITRGGQPVADLTIDDFELYDGKKKQPITAFKAIDLRQPETRDTLEHRIPMAARRHFLVVFDLAFSRPDSLLKARAAALDLTTLLHPSDLAGVVTYNSIRGVETVLNFTSDRRQLHLAIETLGVMDSLDRGTDPLGLVIGSLRATSHSGERLGRALEDEEELRIREAVNRIARAEKAAQVNRLSAFTKNMEGLAEILSAIKGNKHLVFFSEGIPNDLIIDEIISKAGSAGIRSDHTLGGTGGGGGGVLAMQGHAETETSNIGQASRGRNQLESMIEAFRRAGCLIQAVDVGGARALNEIGGRASGEHSLVAMSQDTGGELFRNFNDLGVAMKKMLDRSAVTYLLTFQPRDLPLDGDYHRLQVKLVNSPRGVRVSHRAGYNAPTSFQHTSVEQQRLAAAEILLSDEDSGDLEAALFAAPIRVEGQQAYVALLLEIFGTSLLDPQPKNPLPAPGPLAERTLKLELFAYATDPQGGVHDFFSQAITLDLNRTEDSLRHGGVKFWGHFDLPPGTYVARMLLRDQDGRHAMRQKPFAVPAPENGDRALLPPLFPEPPTRWILVREAEDRRRQLPYPFMIDDQPYIPAARPVVPSEGSTPFLLRGVNLGDDVRMLGQVVDPDGIPVSGATLEIDSPSEDHGEQMATAQLLTRGLPAGEYVLVSTAVSTSAAPLSSSIRFVVRQEGGRQ